MTIKQNLGIIISEHKILLGMKKRGFGEGYYNGIGGKVRDSETIEQSLERECLEEAEIRITNYERRGIINFHFPDKEIEVSIYAILEYDGESKESEEMRWEWFDLDKIPYERMWPADRHGFPIFLEGRTFSGEVTFDNDKKVVNYKFNQ